MMEKLIFLYTAKLVFYFRIIIHCIINYRLLLIFELFKRLYKQIHTV